MSGIKVALASDEDIAAAADLIFLYRSFYGVQDQNEDEIYSFVKERISNEQSKIFIAKDEQGKAVGFIQLYPSYSTVSLRPQWILNDLYVVEEYRRKGAATALMTAVKEYFRDRAKGFILVTDKTNHTAKSFYDKNGWKTDEYDFYTFYY
ncbi:MAG: GNAT family N-acetyltransferase [Ruminococcus sp.]|nr:GNAT family N-acetyltransferase [Ruminococcus sp.]